MCEQRLEPRHTELRRYVDAYLEDVAAEIGANDERWKARQTRQLATLSNDVGEVRRGVSALVPETSHTASELYNIKEDLMEQRQVLHEVWTAVRGGESWLSRAGRRTASKLTAGILQA